MLLTAFFLAAAAAYEGFFLASIWAICFFKASMKFWSIAPTLAWEAAVALARAFAFV